MLAPMVWSRGRGRNGQVGGRTGAGEVCLLLTVTMSGCAHGRGPACANLLSFNAIMHSWAPEPNPDPDPNQVSNLKRTFRVVKTKQRVLTLLVEGVFCT